MAAVRERYKTKPLKLFFLYMIIFFWGVSTQFTLCGLCDGGGTVGAD